jgi:hypothetical protein
VPNTERDTSGGSVPCDQDARPGRQPVDALEGDASPPLDYEDHVSELIDTAENLVGNRVVALGLIKAEVDRRIAQTQEWAAPGTKERTEEVVEHDHPGQNTGGDMATHPGLPAQDRRPFTGFDLEVATYVRLKPDLISRFPGKFVVIVGNDIEGPVDTFREALRAGYHRFGLGPLFVKQVLTVEPVVEVTRDVVPCRS